MDRLPVAIFDAHGNFVAKGWVAKEGGRFRGTADLGAMPAEMRRTFEEFEEVVNGQMFSILDEIENKIAAFGLSIAFGEGPAISAENLQIYPSTGAASFELARKIAAPLPHS